MQTWQIGDVTITRIVEFESPFNLSNIIDAATREQLLAIPWLRPHFVTEKGHAVMSVYALVVESQGERIVVDTCVGNDKNRPGSHLHMLQLPFLEDLEAAGFTRDSIDRVLCTHLHIDHVGWNTMLVDGQWVPTFPRARYLIGRTEWEETAKDTSEEVQLIVGDSVRPIFDAGLVDLVDGDHRLTDEVWLEPTPGHTAGHYSVHIRSGGAEAVITGDVMHHPVQIAHPDWPCGLDVDGEQAVETRRRFVERYGDAPVLVFGTHFATPAAGRIVRDGDTWRLDV